MNVLGHSQFFPFINNVTVDVLPTCASRSSFAGDSPSER